MLFLVTVAFGSPKVLSFFVTASISGFVTDLAVNLRLFPLLRCRCFRKAGAGLALKTKGSGWKRIGLRCVLFFNTLGVTGMVAGGFSGRGALFPLGLTIAVCLAFSVDLLIRVFTSFLFSLFIRSSVAFKTAL